MSLITRIQELATRIATEVKGKQNTLVSGTNLKSINGATLLAGGNLDLVQGTTKITVGTTAPSSPNVGDLWVDTN